MFLFASSDLPNNFYIPQRGAEQNKAFKIFPYRIVPWETTAYTNVITYLTSHLQNPKKVEIFGEYFITLITGIEFKKMLSIKNKKRNPSLPLMSAWLKLYWKMMSSKFYKNTLYAKKYENCLCIVHWNSNQCTFYVHTLVFHYNMISKLLLFVLSNK